MQFIALVSCFFLLCYSGHHHARHHHVVKHHYVSHRAPVVKPIEPLVDPVLRPTGSCEIIGQAYDDFFYTWSNGYGSHDVPNNDRDRFVSRYPANEQRKVLICLEKTGRGN